MDSDSHIQQDNVYDPRGSGRISGNGVYKGEVSKTGIGSVIYTVTYTGSKIPVLPGLDPDITVSQIASRDGRWRFCCCLLLISAISAGTLPVFTSITKNAASTTS